MMKRSNRPIRESTQYWSWRPHCFSQGFTTAGGTRLEKEAADLMLRRTEAMQ